MAPGGILLSCLLLLGLLLGLSWGPAALGSPVVESGEFWAEHIAEAGGNQRPWLGTPSPGARLRRAAAGPCQLRSLTLPVAELGLGYASEERVVFSYCAGSCPRGAHTQHGLTLARLWGQGRAHGGPCSVDGLRKERESAWWLPGETGKLRHGEADCSTGAGSPRTGHRGFQHAPIQPCHNLGPIRPRPRAQPNHSPRFQALPPVVQLPLGSGP
ncbi:persephin [Trichechus manatus latirostris]|uniref:Persephin n=1 Tax=Trichechus manatus latirostris TaxID=127582 RepID=A0A2Y9RAF1_TRIMA|nr:persephin [Trichechus manatus latirostris]